MPVKHANDRSGPTFLSLGQNCEVAHQLRLWREEISQHSQLQAIDGRLPSGSHFFDWTISPIEGVIKCVETNFSHVFERESLEVTEKTDSNGYNYVIDRGAGIMFQHLFTRERGIVSHDTVSFEYSERKEKVSYLIGKFHQVLDEVGTVVFLRRADDSWSSLCRLANAIASRRRSGDFRLVSIRQKPFTEDTNSGHPNIDMRIVPAGPQWHGDTEAWRAIFTDLLGAETHSGPYGRGSPPRTEVGASAPSELDAGHTARVAGE